MSEEAYAEALRFRMMQELAIQAVPFYWLRRAAAYEGAKSRPEDRVGSEVTPDERMALDEALQALADECRRRAETREAMEPDWWKPILDAMQEGTASQAPTIPTKGTPGG